jgi:hypothetical protein
VHRGRQALSRRFHPDAAIDARVVRSQGSNWLLGRAIDPQLQLATTATGRPQSFWVEKFAELASGFEFGATSEGTTPRIFLTGKERTRAFYDYIGAPVPGYEYKWELDTAYAAEQ